MSHRTLPAVLLLVALFLTALPLAAQETVRPERPRLTKAERTIQKRAIRVLRKAREGTARVAAAKALADLGDESALAALKAEVLQHPNDPYAYAALVWLGVEPYVDKAREAVADPETPVAVVTIYGAAFTRRPHPDVRARLLTAWKDASLEPMERLWAACILVEMGDASVRRFVEGYLDDADAYVAAVAAAALHSAGHAPARDKLLSALRAHKSDLQDIAAMALGEHPERDALSALGKALRRAREPHDKVWLAWAVLRTLDYRWGADS